VVARVAVVVVLITEIPQWVDRVYRDKGILAEVVLRVILVTLLEEVVVRELLVL
jgi:hypothetical protein